MKDGELIIEVAANDQEYARTGRISVIPYNSTGSAYEEIIINQSSATFSVEQSKYAVHVDGETLNTLVSSSRGLSIKAPTEASDWLATEMTDLGNDNYRITTVIKKNESLDVRSATVELYSGDGTKYLGKIEYVQSSSVEDELSNMVLVVRPNMANDFTVEFMIGQCSGYDENNEYFKINPDCYIDWGDGQAERCMGKTNILLFLIHTTYQYRRTLLSGYLG